MSRNFVYNDVPSVRINRSKFPFKQGHKTTMSVGTLYPVFCQEVYPGETYKIRSASIARAAYPFIKVPMDDLYIDINFFFVPNRLVWDHWEEFLGANKTGPWANTQSYSIPQVVMPTYGFWNGSEGGSSIADWQTSFHATIACHLGVPYGTTGTVNALPFRAFNKIYEDWYRDENSETPAYLTTGDENVTCNVSAYAPDNVYGLCPKVNKFQDRFTTSLPAPQKGDAPTIQFSINANIPVQTTAVDNILTDAVPVHYRLTDNGAFRSNSFMSSLGLYGDDTLQFSSLMLADNTGRTPDYTNQTLYPSNLWAIANNLETGTTIDANDLRMLFQTQKLLERQARGGTRIKEILLNEWGVNNNDARLQLSEFLGGVRNPLGVYQVPTTANVGVDTEGPASLSSFGYGNQVSGFTKSFTEHGFIIGVCCIRQRHSYQQGLERFWSRRTKLDFYNPVYANIGEQPVFTREIYSHLEQADVYEKVFGYQEAWSDLRSRQNLITGQMASPAENGIVSYDNWHFGDVFANPPVLSKEFLEETSDNVARTMSFSSEQYDQFLFDFSFNGWSVKPLPVYSVPSLIDHH